MTKAVKKQILAAQIASKRSELNENSLYLTLSAFFEKLKQKVLKEFDTYYTDDIMLQGQLDLILAPIHISHKTYFNIIKKHIRKEHKLGASEAKRLVKLAQKKHNSSDKAEKLPINSIIKKGELFGTSEYSRQKLFNQSFKASESTKERIDSDINKILSDGYTEGWGQNAIAADITKRFDQLKDWEAKRIARTEIHNAHNMGMMQTYEEMDVEYIQWNAAHDARVRDSHAELSGEITKFGSTYSNGLSYPGDTSGPIEEWINCRCVNSPFVIPPGYIAPTFTPFREEDLIATLDFWNQDAIISKATNESIDRNAMLYGVPIKESLIKNNFAIPTEDLSEFGISKQGLKTIQQIQKRNFGESIEYGFRFDKKTGKILSDELQGNGKNVDIPASKRGKFSTIHNHTGDSLNPPSADDFYTYFNYKREDVAINLSRNETWLIKSEKFNSKKVEKICQKVYNVEVKQIKKLNNEYEQLKMVVQKGKMSQKELDNYLANEFINKHNKECGDNLLKELSNIKGLKVKRIFNDTTINPDKIKDLKNIKTIKPNKKSKYSRKSPQIIGYDDYALNESELKRYEELKELKEKEGGLGLIQKRSFNELADRKEFNELRNKILLKGGDPNNVFELDGAEGVRYEKLFKKFENWVPKEKIEIKPIKINKNELNINKDAFKLTSDEKNIYKQLKTNTAALSKEERQYKIVLDDKIELNKLHNKLINEGLDKFDSEKYIKLYSQYSKEWDLPELTTDFKFTTSYGVDYRYTDEFKNIKEFKLSKKDAEKLYELEKKELIGQKLTSKQLKEMELLQSQEKFSYLTQLNKQNKGLKYEHYEEYKKLFKQLKTKLKLNKSILEQPLSNYKSDIPLDKNPKNFKKFKGTTDDGLLPNGENIEDFFTIDAREMTNREYEVAQRWLGSDYKAFTNFEVDCERDVKKFEKYIYEKAKAYEKDNSLKYYQYYYDEIRDRATGKLLKSEAKKLAGSIAHDVPTLDNILNNQLKQGMTLWRVQENHNLPSTVVGDIMEFPNFRSTAISKKGALWFSATNRKEMNYIIEIEAPKGTQGSYLAPIKQGNWYAPPEDPHNPLNGTPYANEMEFLLKKCKVKLVKFGGKPVKGANGEDLIPIKLRVVGYK